MSAKLLVLYEQLKREHGGVPETPQALHEFVMELNNRRGGLDQRRLNQVEELVQAPPGVLLQRPTTDEDSSASLESMWDDLHRWKGVVRLLPWRKTTRVNYEVDGRRYRVYKLGAPYTVMPYPIGYPGIDGITRYRLVCAPRDAAPLVLGTYVRCPKCRGVAPLSWRERTRPKVDSRPDLP